MLLYRAMSEKEAIQTLKENRPVFIRRFKYFSPDKDWVISRVMSGKFNNSNFCPERYTNLISFKIGTGVSFFDKGKREWKLDRRKLPLIQFLEVRKEIL